MRNLKRVLSLVLAAMMLIGMMVIGASAAGTSDFGDAEKVTYNEAVDVITGLGIMEGYDNGDFGPGDTLTREQAAKIISIIKLGTDKVGELGNNTPIFTDVPAGWWSAGYIAYCNNARVMVGYGNGVFGRTDELTGVQFGKMLLVALGYDPALEGYEYDANWDMNVASQMYKIGVYVPGTDLSAPLTREQAAQMAFLALRANKVEYNNSVYGTRQAVPAGGLLGDSFGLAPVEGVMTANEYADLDSPVPDRKGQSTIGDITYNYASDLTEIGLNYEGWAYGLRGTKTIIHLEAVGNTVYENDGVAKNLTNFRQVTGMNDNSVGYINFGETTFNYIADIRIVYDVDGEGDEYDQEIIRANAPISNTQFAEMKSIFDKSQEEGWIAVGTVDVVDDTNDLSDTISWSTFRSRYLTTNDRIGVDVTGADQGEWLKVIDNDGDGFADYVFLTRFTMTTVVGLNSKTGVLTLDNGASNLTLDAADYATSAELAVGDVVIYTTIDGTTYVEPAPSFTGKVDKYTYKTEVLTVEGEDYPQSEIDGRDVMFDAGYYTENEEAEKNTEYTYYLDFFGNIRAFEEPADAANSLVLLTDGWYRSTKTGGEYAVRAYLDDEIGVYDVNNRAVGAFIDSRTSGNSWGNLDAFKAYNDPRYSTDTPDGKTNLARYSADEDGVLSLATAKTYVRNGRNENDRIATDYVELTKEDLRAGQRTYNGTYEKIAADAGLPADTGSVKVQATKDTVFYYVWTDTVGTTQVVKSVIAVTGYANAYAVKNQIAGEDNILKAYAVARNTTADAGGAPYWVAEAIVIETEHAVVNGANNMVLGYNVLNKTVRDFGYLESVLPTGELGDLEVETIDGLDPVDYNDINRTTTIPNPAFYLSSGTEGEVDIDSIDDNYGSYGIYTALIDREVALKDYIVTTDGTELSYNENNVIVYHLSENTKGTANLITHEDRRGDLELEVDEYYILVADARGSIVYAILVSNIAVDDIAKTVDKDVDGKGKDVAAELFEDIYLDNQPAADELALTALTIKGEPVKLDQKTKTGTVTIPYASWNDDTTIDRVSGVVTTGSASVDYFNNTKSGDFTETGKTKLSDTTDDTIYVVLTSTADKTKMVTYTITVTLVPGGTNATAKTITVKGVQATRNAEQTGKDGTTSGTAWEYSVTVPYNNNQNKDIMQLVVVPTDEKAKIQSSISDGTDTGIKDTYAEAKAAGDALTAKGDFTFSIKSEDESKAEVFYKVNVTLDQSQKVTLSWGTKDNTGSQTPSDGDVPSDKALELSAEASSNFMVKGFTYTIAGVVTEATPVPVVDGKPTLTTDILKQAEGKTITVNVVTAATVNVKAASGSVILIEQDGKWITLDSSQGVDVETNSTIRVKIQDGKSLTADHGTPATTGESSGGFTIWTTTITEATTLTVAS